jgi:hypothetical protein
VRSPQLLLSVTLHAVPTPPQIGGAQHAPTTCPAGFLQIWPPGQPQLMVPPQPSPIVPHCVPQAAAAVFLVQQVPVVPAVFAPHVWPAPQPQLMVPPHPSESAEPQRPA